MLMPMLECIILICHASPIRGACVRLSGSEWLESLAVFDLSCLVYVPVYKVSKFVMPNVFKYVQILKVM